MKKLVMLLTVFVFGFTLAACQPKEETVKFGVLGPLSGQYADYGQSVENAARLAAEEINEAGGVLGKNLEIIAYDSKGDAVEGVNGYNRLVNEDGIDALIGGTFSGVTVAIKQLAIDDGLPVLTPTATNPSITLNAPNIFRACYTDSYQGSVAAQFTIDTLNSTKAAVYYNVDDQYSSGLADAFVATYQAASLTVDSYTFTGETADFNATLTQIKAGNYDVVFVPAYVAEVGAILTQASSIDFGDTVFMGGDGWDGIEALYSTVAEGYYFVNHYAKTDPSEQVQAFVANYTEKYGSAPSALAALAYDAVYAMALAFENAGTTDSSAVVTALSNLEYNDAVTGAIKFDSNGDPVKSITIIQVVNGEHVVVGKVQGE